MAEKSGLWTTGGASGDQQASYSQSDDSDIKRIIAACSGFEGVAPGYLNELACAPNGLNKVSVATGGAMVDGKYFINDASQDVAIPSAVGAGNTRIDRIVLRADWANFNVSVHRIAGTDAGSPVAPAITQTSEATYDIKLCQVLVTTGGVVTVTDERVWARVPVDDTTISFFSGTLRVKDVGITAAKIATNAVETAKIKDANVTPAKTTIFPTNANAKIYCGDIYSGGSAKRIPSGWSSEWTGSNYKVTHNFGNKNYIVMTNVNGLDAVGQVTTRENNEFYVRLSDMSSTNIETQWSFILIRY